MPGSAILVSPSRPIRCTLKFLLSLLLVCVSCVAVHLFRAVLILRQEISLNVSRVHPYFSMQYMMTGSVQRAGRICDLVWEVIHLFPIRSIAREPRYGGNSTGGKVVLMSPSTASLAVSEAIRSHSMFTVTDKGCVFSIRVPGGTIVAAEGGGDCGCGVGG